MPRRRFSRGYYTQVFSFLFFFPHTYIHTHTATGCYIYMFATRFFLFTLLLAKILGAKAFIGSRALFPIILFSLLFFSPFLLIFVFSYIHFGKWVLAVAYKRMDRYVGSSIMNNCILYGFWRFHYLTRYILVIIMVVYVDAVFRLP